MEESLIHFTLEFYEWVDPAKNIVELAWGFWNVATWVCERRWK